MSLQKGTKFSLALASTLSLDATPTEPAYNAVRITNFMPNSQAEACELSWLPAGALCV